MAKKQHQEREEHSEAPQAAATQPIVIQGFDFTVPAPYKEGHTLTANEAVALNTVLGENLRNNFATVVKKAKEVSVTTGAEVDLQALAAQLAEYAAQYSFSGKRMAREPVDPIAREAHKIAKSILLAKLKEKNIDVKSLAEGKLESMVVQLVANKPEITEEATRRVQATKTVAEDVLDGLL